MTFLPGLTSTRKDLIGYFIEDMRYHGILRIALFPTCLDLSERRQLYGALEEIPGLSIPHVHLRSDCGPMEIDYLRDRFETEVFNIHPAASAHPYLKGRDDQRKYLYVENVEVVPSREELSVFAGLCPDFSHWENAKQHNRAEYQGFEELFKSYPVGCCHISALRVGEPNDWSGEWDHHGFTRFSEFDYLKDYRPYLPPHWLSLELENDLADQLKAIDYLEKLLA